jgi:putative nucleotidyltransferase with HDIG domain
VRATKLSMWFPSNRSPTLVAFVGVVSAIGVVVIGHAIYRLPGTPHPLGWLAVGTLAVIAGSFPLKVPGVPMYLSVADTFFITSAVWFGPAPATLTIAVDSLIISYRRGNLPDQLLFNTTSSAISLWAAAQAFFWLEGTNPLVDVATPPGVGDVFTMTLLAGVYFGLNSGLVTTAVALQKRVSPVTLWREYFAVVAVNHFAAASAAFFLVVLMRYVSPFAIAGVVPLLVIFYVATQSWLGRLADAEQHVANVNRLYLSTVSALATAIEARDGVTSQHVHRVRADALRLAHALHVTDLSTLQAIEAAALLHDTGKLGMPEHILNKPGALTPSEFETIKTHVDIGVDILSSIDFPYPVVPIVRAHHEKWDGTGYPAGLRGEEIPIGARILSVVDCFDALTSERPYRRAMSEAEALEIIVARRGTAYDPEVVDAFLRQPHHISVATPRPRLEQGVDRIRRSAALTRAQPPRRARSNMPPHASEELLAFVSLARVTTRTPTIADIGALAWGHLRQIAPGASLVLFTVDAARQAVVARYAAGAGADGLVGIVIAMGQRVTGWAAATGRSVVNTDARLDLSDDLVESLHFALAVPLVVDSAVVGVMTLYAPEPFDEHRSRLLEMIAPHLAMSVASTLKDRSASTPMTSFT